MKRILPTVIVLGILGCHHSVYTSADMPNMSIDSVVYNAAEKRTAEATIYLQKPVNKNDSGGLVVTAIVDTGDGYYMIKAEDKDSAYWIESECRDKPSASAVKLKKGMVIDTELVPIRPNLDVILNTMVPSFDIKDSSGRIIRQRRMKKPESPFYFKTDKLYGRYIVK